MGSSLLPRFAQPCDIQLDALPVMRVRGEVHTIVPTVDRSKATVLVKVRFRTRTAVITPPKGLKDGSRIKVAER